MDRSESVTVSVIRVVGSPVCVAIDDGNSLHNVVAGIIDRSEIAIVDFAGVRRLTTAFLNAAIGQLYNEYSEAEVREHLRLRNMSPEALTMMKKVVDNAKVFFNREGELLSKLVDGGE